MKHLRNTVKYLALFGVLVLAASCSDNKSDQSMADKQSTVPVKKDQFSFYKHIEIRPGLSFEVVSWGKGVDTVGGYLVLMSDSLKNNFKSLSNEREGIIKDAWNMDMDNDGNPEIYIEFVSEKIKSDLHVYEYAGNSFSKITFPGLSNSLKKAYGGDDKFTIDEGDLYRSFPVVNPRDTSEKAGDIKQVKYRLSGNSFSSSEVEKEK